MLYHEGFAFFNVIATLVFYIFYIECKQVPHTGSRDGEPTRALLLKKKKKLVAGETIKKIQPKIS